MLPAPKTYDRTSHILSPRAPIPYPHIIRTPKTLTEIQRVIPEDPTRVKEQYYTIGLGAAWTGTRPEKRRTSLQDLIPDYRTDFDLSAWHPQLHQYRECHRSSATRDKDMSADQGFADHINTGVHLIRRYDGKRRGPKAYGSVMDASPSRMSYY